MPSHTTRQRPPATRTAANPEELVARIERLQRRVASLSETRRTADADTRRQRAAGRRP